MGLLARSKNFVHWLATRRIVRWLDGWLEAAARWRITPWLVAGFGFAALLIMMEISRLLGTLESAGERRYTMGAFTGWPGFPPSNDDVDTAIELWSKVAKELFVVTAVPIWVKSHILLDALLFTPAYAFGLWRLLRFIDTRYQDTRPRLWPGWLALVVLVIDELENVLTWIVLQEFDAPGEFWTRSLAWVTACKWVVLGGVLAVAALRYLAGRQHLRVESGTPALGQLFARTPAAEAAPRPLFRHRTQVAVVLLLAALVALPAGGPLEQLPDILRAWTDESLHLMDFVGDVAGPVGALMVLCVALWVAGRLALLDGVGTYRRPPRSPRRLLVGMVLGFVVGFVLWQDELRDLWPLGHIPWVPDVRLLGWGTGGVFAVPVVIAALLLLGRIYGLSPWSKNGRPTQLPCELVHRPTGDARRLVRDTGRVLAVVPLVIAGLGLVRAFAAPLLLAGTSEGFPLGEPLGGFAVGLALIPAAALAERSVGKFEAARLGDTTYEERERHTILGECEWDTSSERQREPDAAEKRRLAVPRQGSYLLLGLVLLAGWIAFDPLGSGRLLRSLGVLQLFLATIALIGGFLTRRAELREPMHALGRRERKEPTDPELRHGFARTPVWLLILVVFVAAGRLDTTGGHHDVRLARATQPIEPAAPVEELFDAWLAQAARCLPTGKDTSATGASAVPLLLVAAPGGGIRAAYWTSLVVDRLAEASAKRGNCPALFAAGGVSGGAVGLVGYAAANASVPPAATGPLPASATSAAKAIAGEDAVGAVVAAGLYRDLPRGFHGINRLPWFDAELHCCRVQRHDDRAGVLERVWERRNGRLLGDFYRDLRPPNTPDKPWRPLLLLNATSAASGCRVLVSPLQGAGPTTDCREPVTATTSSQFATGALDAQAYLDGRNCERRAENHTLRLSTAALLPSRFAWVTPTGTMFRCSGSTKEDPATAAVIDGGYLENSGIAALLELWEMLEPVIARHNRTVAAQVDPPPSKVPRPYVMPLFVLADNHYSSVAVGTPPGRVREITAPLVGRSAPQNVVRSSVLEQATLLRFAGSPPGLAPDTRMVLHDGRCVDVRSFRVAPRKRPGVEAPLGWVLSEISTNDLETQLRDLETSAMQLNLADRARYRRPSNLSLLVISLEEQLSLTRLRTCLSGGGPSKAH